MENRFKIVIAKDFGDTPGARYITDGPFSGQLFLEEHLEPKFIDAKENNEKLFIDLDGVFGYPSSFVSGSFGKLSLKYTADIVLDVIDFKSNENTIRLEKIISEIKKPKKK